MKEIQALAFFDLDGTLLNEKSEITPEIYGAINKLKENNVLPVIATGRTIIEIEHIMADSGIDSAIAMNGQFIQVEGQKVYSNDFSIEECKRLYEHVLQNGHELSLYNDQHIWCSNQTETMKNAYKLIHTNAPKVEPLFTNSRVINMMLILSEDGDEYYYNHFPEFTFYRNGPYSIDTVQKGISKGSAVKELMRCLSLSETPTFAFGDGLNDLALFDACQNRIAMGNAKPELKERSTYITSNNTDGGIVKALSYFNLI